MATTSTSTSTSTVTTNNSSTSNNTSVTNTGASGNQPFAGVTLSNSAPVQAMVTVVGSDGQPTDANGVLTGPGLTKTGVGTHTLPATDSSSLTSELRAIMVGNLADTPTFVLDVTAISAPGSTSTSRITTNLVGPPAPIQPVQPPPQMHFIVNSQQVAGQPYTGPVSGISQQLIDHSGGNLNVTASVPNTFVSTGSGNDAIDVSAVNGTNVLDGGGGTNFLTGGSGHDTFYVDARGATADIFSTVKNFHAGDDLTVWGISQGVFTVTAANDVLPTAPGLDFAITAPGKPTVNVNIPGYSTADVTSGKLTVALGHTQDMAGLPGSDYMLVHANA